MHMEFNAATEFTRSVWAATHPIAPRVGGFAATAARWSRCVAKTIEHARIDVLPSALLLG
jgi:hypothetical protein